MLHCVHPSSPWTLIVGFMGLIPPVRNFSTVKMPTSNLSKFVGSLVALVTVGFWLVPAHSYGQTRSGQTRSGKTLSVGDDFEAEGLFPNLSLGGLKSDKATEPITWSAKYRVSESDGAASNFGGVLEVVAAMAPSWHIYSTTQPKGGPLRTSISIAGPGTIKLAGEATPDREPTRSVSSVYNGLTVEEFGDRVTWTLPLTMPIDFDGPIQVSVRGLVCDSIDGRCMPTNETLVANRAARSGAAVSASKTLALPTAKIPAMKTPAKTDTPAFRDGDYAVQWTASLQPASVRPGARANLMLTAQPDATFHVYQAASDASSFSTNFVVTQKSGLRFGSPETDARVVSEQLVPTMPAIEYHPGEVTWNIPVVVPADAAEGKKTISGMVAYLACSDGRCLLPKGLKWEVALNVASGDSKAAAPVTLTSVNFGDVLDAAETTAWVDPMETAPRTDASSRSSEPDGVELADGQSPHDGNQDNGNQDGGHGEESQGIGENKLAQASVAAAPGLTPTVLESSSSDMSFVTMILFAFLGGMVLNVMPCVLPVIGLKVMSFINQAGEDRGRVLTLNLAYVAGIFLVFGVLAGLATFFSFGWGEQFQNFGVRMAAIVGMFAFALSYLGVWEIPAPGMASSQASQNLQNKEGVAGAFSKGVFATILATPCSAPLLGSVFSALLGAPALTVFTVFFAIAAGMSFPYVIIGFVPAAARFLPKPGAWMETFKELMAFVMLGAVAFFFYQFSDGDKLAVFITLLGVWFGCWIMGRVPAWESPQKRILAFGGGVIASVAIGWFGFNGIAQDHELEWVDYSEVALERYQEQGRTVMVDFSAKWCVNCLVNLENAIDTPKVANLVNDLDVVAVYADWTDPNPAIAKKLNELKSNAIPVLAIYPGGRPDEPIILRDLITEGDVLEALKQAGPSVSPGALVAQAAPSRN